MGCLPQINAFGEWAFLPVSPHHCSTFVHFLGVSLAFSSMFLKPVLLQSFGKDHSKHLDDCCLGGKFWIFQPIWQPLSLTLSLQPFLFKFPKLG